jgi:GDP-L-fucose synthase
LAKKSGEPLTIWGDGSPLREFIYSNDLARLTMAVLKMKEHDKVIISSNSEISIKDLASMVCRHMDFDGEIIFDTSKPNGQLRRPSDISRLMSLVPNLKFTAHDDGIGQTVKWFIDNYPEVRT